MASTNNVTPIRPTPGLLLTPRKREGARRLTPAELEEWYTWLNSHIERQRLLVVQNAAMPRSSRRLMNVHAHSAYVAMGMAWWNGMTEHQRLEALRAADTACPAEAWAHWRATGGFKCEESAHG